MRSRQEAKCPVLPKIKKLCEARGTTIYNLAKEIDVSKATIWTWDKAWPNSLLLKRVADYFGVTVDYLMQHDQ